jgi:hypothetical protein
LILVDLSSGLFAYAQTIVFFVQDDDSNGPEAQLDMVLRLARDKVQTGKLHLLSALDLLYTSFWSAYLRRRGFRLLNGSSLRFTCVFHLVYRMPGMLQYTPTSLAWLRSKPETSSNHCTQSCSLIQISSSHIFYGLQAVF